jgi:demethylmacrocin O-methyltransferase
VNDAAVWILWRIRGVQSRLPPALATPFQRVVERAASRSPGALSILYDIDKGPKAHDYTQHYRRYLGPLRSETLTLLEIGVLKGGSMRLWRRYLPKARIVGIDLQLPNRQLPGVELHRGDQSDEEFLASLVSRYGGFDVVIDDGSHIGRHIQASFRALFPAVRPGGWYVIEDLQTSYSTSHEGGPAGMPGTGVDLIKGLVDRAQTDSGDRDVAELHLYDRIAFIRRAGA